MSKDNKPTMNTNNYYYSAILLLLLTIYSMKELQSLLLTTTYSIGRQSMLAHIALLC
jgi:hypothetical protein